VEIVFDALGRKRENVMAAESKYTLNRPARYTRRVPIFWWVRKWNYVKFILRELSSVAIALFALELILLVGAVSAGRSEYDEFLYRLQDPVSVGFHLVALAFVLFHSVTWFNLAPRAMVIRVGKHVVPPMVIVLMNYAAWIVVSVAVAWILIGV
jgi:fumarate reductase subunit C